VQGPKLITASTTDSLGTAFKKLCDNGIMAVPVVDPKGSIKGTLSIFDIICNLHDNFDQAAIKDSVKRTYDFFSLVIAQKELSSKAISTIDQIGDLDPVIMMDDDKNLYDVVQMMVMLKGRRVLIQNRESQALMGQISQYGLLEFLWNSKTDMKTSFWDMKIYDIPNLISKNVITVKLMSPIYEAFKTMRKQKICACGIVDDNTGKLVGNVSAADVKLLGSDLSFFQALAFTVNEYTKLEMEKTGRKDEVIAIKEGRNVTVGEVVQKLLKHRIHRLYITDAHDKPVGVISMTDIIFAIANTPH